MIPLGNTRMASEKAHFGLSLTTSPGAKPTEKTQGTASIVRAVNRAAGARQGDHG